MTSVRIPLLVTLILILLSGLGIGMATNSLFFHRFLITSNDSRLLTIAFDVRDVFARAASLGLTLSQFQGGDQVLTEARHTDPSIVATVAFEAEADTFRALPMAGAVAGTRLPPSWLQAIRRAPGADHWPIGEEDGFGVLVPVRNGFGGTIGLIALIQSRAVLERPQHEFTLVLIRLGLLVALPSILIVGLLVPRILRPLVARLPAWSGYVDALLTRPSSTAPPPPPARGDDLLGDLLREPLSRLSAPPNEDRPQPDFVPANPERAVQRLKARVVTLAVAVILVTATISAVTVARHQIRTLPAELLSKPLNVTALLARDIVRAVEMGIPLESLRGIDRLFHDARAANPEIAFLRLFDAAGRSLAGEGTVPELPGPDVLPLSGKAEGIHPLHREGLDILAVPVTTADGRRFGTIVLGVSDEYVIDLITERMIDIVTVEIVTAIVTVEWLLLALDRTMVAPLLNLHSWSEAVARGERPRPPRSRSTSRLAELSRRVHAVFERWGPPPDRTDRRRAQVPWPVMLRYIRVCLFLFVFADTLPLSLLPLYANELYQPWGGLGRDLLLAAPVVMYWLTSAVVQLPCAALLDRFSHRIVFAGGAVAATLGGVATAWATDLPSLLAARAIAGVGLGMVFTVCQAATLTHVPANRRAQGVASFSGAFFLATFCGTALGGVLADAIGLRSVFVVVAALSLIAAGAAWIGFGQSRESRRRQTDQTNPRGAWRDYLDLARNPHFAGLLLLAALPNRMFNVALIFFLVPLCLDGEGLSKAEIARVVSIYGLTMAFVAPLAASLADRFHWHARFVIAGSLICSAGALLAFPLTGPWGMVAAVIGMGLGQSMAIPSQMTLIPTIAARQADSLGLPRIYAIFRVVERVPAFLGPILAGLLVAGLSYGTAVAVWGGALAVATLGLSFLFRHLLRSRRTQPC